MDMNFVEWAEEVIEALEDFCTSLQSILEGRLAPLLVGAKELANGLTGLWEKASNKNWSPVYEAMEELLQVMKPSLTIRNQSLVMDMEVPFSQGGIATL